MNATPIQIEHCELCVIGTGIAGLNALHSSTSYLPANAKVIIVDRRAAQQSIGGMWNDVYPFVRLHQPHKTFTVGDKKWTLDRKPSYLAERSEILSHLNSCYQETKTKLQLIEYFGYEYQHDEEVSVDDGYEAHIHFKAVDNELPPLIIKAKKCIKAFGHSINSGVPLQLSTNKVQSTVPDAKEVSDGTIAKNDKPIYIIGSGKTAVDTAHFLLKQNPNRKIHFVLGKGTYFFDREKLFPTGSKKNWTGVSMIIMFIDIYRNFEADNLDASTEYVKKKYGVSPFQKTQHNVYAFLSRSEADEVRAGIATEVNEYLDDVKEEAGQLWMYFKSGRKQSIAADSWIINCTGLLYKKSSSTKQKPIVSPHGTMLSIHREISAMVFTPLGGYLLPHMWFRDLFKKVPLQYFNHETLFKKDKEIFFFAISAQAVHNFICFMEVLPKTVFSESELNGDKWYPMHRQIITLLKITLNKKKYLKDAKIVLDQVMRDYDIEHGIVGQ